MSPLPSLRIVFVIFFTSQSLCLGPHFQSQSVFILWGSVYFYLLPLTFTTSHSPLLEVVLLLSVVFLILFYTLCAM